MKIYAMLVAVMFFVGAPVIPAQDRTLDSSDQPRTGGIELTPQLMEELERLEADLVGPIAPVDYALVKTTAETPDFASVMYSRMATLGFPDHPVPQLNFAEGSYWMLGAPLEYRPGNSHRSVTVPAGFVHDFASVPSLATPFVPTHGPYNRAAIVHDFLYWTEPCTRLQADNLFLISMIEAGVSPIRRWGIYRAVRLGGWAAWSANREERSMGLPRVVPEDRLPFPADAKWSHFRASLFDEGVRDSVVVKDKSFCDIGNSTAVPAQLMGESDSGAN